MPKVGWCDNCNVPILDGRKCGACHSRSTKLRFPKAELKPIFKEEKRLYQKILSEKRVISDVLLPKGLCFHNIMGEVVVDGKKVFRLSYDEKLQDWKVKFFRNFFENISSFKGSELSQVIEANEHILREKEREAILFLKKTVRKFAHLPLAVSFSGGKDSAVTLALAKLIRRRLDVIFLNTTIEFDETVQYVHDIARQWKLDLIEVKPPQDFFQLCRELGPPSAKMKWCCKTQKFSPQNNLINERYPNGVLVISGIRKAESNIRSRFKKVQKNKMIPKQVLAFPILNWTSLDVWLYLLWKKIPYNKMYNNGFARIGCWACPEKSLRDFKLVETIRPDLVKRLGQVLRNYADQTQIENPDFWIRSGKWRFRKTKWIKTVACTSSKLCSLENQIVYNFADTSNINRVKEFIRVFGQTTNTGKMMKISSPNTEITVIGNKMRAEIKNPEILPVLEKQLARALNCVGCGACVGICPAVALKIESGKLRIGAECTNCLRCVTSNGIRMSCVSVNYKPLVLSIN